MIDLTVKTLDSQNHAFSLEDDQITVRGFKEYIAESVAVPADSQRLIYCGRVLQDEKKLNDYDVNGKVIHLVQRAPPQPGQRNNDNGQTQGQNHPQGWPNPQRTHYRLTRAQMHGNALYLGAVAGPPLPPVPPEIVEGHGLPFTTLSNPLAVSRLAMVRRMLDRVNELLTVLQDPASPINPPQPEPTPSTTSHQEQPQEVETDQEHNNNARADNLPEASAIAIAAALSAIDHNVILLRRDVNGTETQSAAPESEPQPEARSLPLQQPQPQAQPQPQPQPQPQSQPQSQPQPQPQPQPPQEPPSEEGSTSTSEGPANRRGAPQAGWTPQVADVLQRLISTHDSLRPFLERYTNLMRTDPVLPPGPGPAGVEDSQRIVDGVSECLHFMSHACHSLSDIIVDMAQQPPRNLRCRPTYIQHSVVLQSGIPIQVEAHISVHGRNSNNNVANEESNEASTGTGTGGSTERNGESSTQQNDSDSANQQTSGQQQQPQQPQQPQEGQTQSPFGAVFNLPNNVEVLMEVSPEGNIDAPARSEQNQSEETNNNNSHGARINGSGMFPWGATPPPDFIRNLMQVVAGHVVQSGINTTTLTTRNPPSTGTGQQPHGTSDNGSTNSGQSTQARSNVGTHPTTATQTRSTSRPHIFHQQAHPLGVGMAIGQELFDPFLPCNSRHIRQPSNAPGSTVTATSQGTRGGQTSTSETQAQSQSASASIGTNGASTANAASPPVSQRTPPNSLVNLLQEMFGSAIAQSDEDTEINHHDMTASEFVRSIIDIVGEHDTQDGAAAGGAGRSGPPLLSRRSTMAEFLASVGVYMDVLSIADPMVASNFLGNLMVFLVQNITLEGLDRLWTGHGEPIVQLRRPFHEFIQACFQNSSPEEIQEQTLHTILTQLRPHLQSLQAKEEVFGRPSHSQRVDIAATVESLLRRHIGDILRNVFNTEVNDTRFEQEVLGSFRNLGRQLCAVLRYSVRGGEVGLDRLVSNFVPDILSPIFCIHDLRFFMVDVIKVFVSIICRSLCVSQPPDAEIIPLLVYKDAAHQTTPASSAPTEQSTTQEAPEPMETEAVDERTTYEAAAPDDTEEITETFPGHQVLPPDWMPIIARDSVRQRRQLQTQGMVSGRVTTFSDAYLGALPTKRRKIIEQQKSRLLVSPTPNHSAITTSMERLIREGVSRAGIDEVEGAAVAAAADPGVRRAFGQAIRDCLHPHRYETPDFPDPLRFPNASKYFAEQDRPPK